MHEKRINFNSEKKRKHFFTFPHGRGQRSQSLACGMGNWEWESCYSAKRHIVPVSFLYVNFFVIFQSQMNDHNCIIESSIFFPKKLHDDQFPDSLHHVFLHRHLIQAAKIYTKYNPKNAHFIPRLNKRFVPLFCYVFFDKYA